MRRRRPGRARRRAGVGRGRASALLGRHQRPQDLSPERVGRAPGMADSDAGRVDRPARPRWVHRRHRSGDRAGRPRPGPVRGGRPDRACSAIDGGYGITDGPAFGPDGARMYHSDTLRQVTYAFDLDAAGEATNRRVFVQFGAGDGHPDGMTVDAEGCLWIALWGGWCVRRFSPDGDLLRTVE